MKKNDINVSLDNVIALFKYYDSIKTTDKKLKKIFFTDIKKLAVIFVMTTAFVTSTIVFNNPLILLFPTLGFGGYVFITYARDMFKTIPKNNFDYNKFKEDLESDEKEDFDPEEFELELDRALEENPYIDKMIDDFDDGLDRVTFDDIDNYYSDDFKLFKDNYKDDKLAEKFSNLALLNNKKELLNKDNSIIKVIKEIDIYKIVYKLPELTISNKEWDILVNNIYNFLLNESSQSKYYEILSFLVQYTFAKCMVKKLNISMFEFVDSLEDILPDFNKHKVIKLQKKILKECEKSKIIKFDFIKKKILK